MKNLTQYPKARMTSLYESIFSNRQEISKNMTDQLYNGFPNKSKCLSKTIGRYIWKPVNPANCIMNELNSGNTIIDWAKFEADYDILEIFLKYPGGVKQVTIDGIPSVTPDRVYEVLMIIRDIPEIFDIKNGPDSWKYADIIKMNRKK